MKKKSFGFFSFFHIVSYWGFGFAALFQSLLFEAVGRAVNPVSGAVGLLWTGNWSVCQSAVETVLRGGTLQPLPEFRGGVVPAWSDFEDVSELTIGGFGTRREEDINVKMKGFDDDVVKCKGSDLDLCLMIGDDDRSAVKKRRREATPSDESETTTLGSRFSGYDSSSSKVAGENKLLRLFI